MGGADGALLLLGVKLGVTEGGSVFIVGALVGEFVGTFVGAFVGEFVGTFVGTFVGGFVGVFVGEFDGEVVGAFVGGFDGALVGLFVGVRLGAGVGDVVFNAIVELFVGALVNKATVGAVVLNCATAASIADAKARRRARLVFIFVCLNKSSKMRLHRCHTPLEITLSSQNLCTCWSLQRGYAFVPFSVGGCGEIKSHF